MLLEAVDQGHTVCAYSGELPKEQFREWTYLQAAGPEHIRYITDQATGKKLASADALADKQISEWLNERFWLFDLERNTRHDPETILRQFEYAHMRYNADVFLVDNIMSVDFDSSTERDFNRVQSKFTQMLVTFSKRRVSTPIWWCTLGNLPVTITRKSPQTMSAVPETSPTGRTTCFSLPLTRRTARKNLCCRS